MLINTPEDVEWRKANDLADVAKFDSSGKATYTFKNVRLTQSGNREVEFTADAFNSDRVKSRTHSVRYPLPVWLASRPVKKGRAHLITIGVNASQSNAYDLRYAAADARKMQEILGEGLAQSARYSEVVQIPLVSDYTAGKKLVENTARKAIIIGSPGGGPARHPRARAGHDDGLLHPLLPRGEGAGCRVSFRVRGNSNG